MPRHAGLRTFDLVPPFRAPTSHAEDCHNVAIKVPNLSSNNVVSTENQVDKAELVSFKCR